MPFDIIRNSIRLNQEDGAITFHLAAFGTDKVCRVTSTALLRLSDHPGDCPRDAPLHVFYAHRLRIAQRAFAYLSRNLLANSVVLRGVDF